MTATHKTQHTAAPTATTSSAIDDARTALLTLGDALKQRYVERDTVVLLVQLAAITREHVYLVSTPGCAKSAIADDFCGAIGGRYFSTLCHKFQSPEDIFGPLSLQALQQDKNVRRVDGYLPTADVAFLDEAPRGSAANLNTMLRILNERTYSQDGTEVRAPLRFAVLAANSMPDDEDGLGALMDRLLFRATVDDIKADSAFLSMVRARRGKGSRGRLPLPVVTLAQLDVLSDASEDMPVTAECDEAMTKIRVAMIKAGMPCSPRRWLAVDSAVRAYALLTGATVATSAHLAVLDHMLWTKPEQLPAVREIVAAHMATWMKAIKDAHGALDEQTSRIQDASRSGSPRTTSINALAVALDAVLAVNSTCAELADTTPEAAPEVAAIKVRVANIRTMVTTAMRGLGLGV